MFTLIRLLCDTIASMFCSYWYAFEMIRFLPCVLNNLAWQCRHPFYNHKRYKAVSNEKQTYRLVCLCVCFFSMPFNSRHTVEKFIPNWGVVYSVGTSSSLAPKYFSPSTKCVRIVYKKQFLCIVYVVFCVKPPFMVWIIYSVEYNKTTWW